MSLPSLARLTLSGSLILALAACGGIGSGDSGLFRKRTQPVDHSQTEAVVAPGKARSTTATREMADESRQRKIWDLFGGGADPNTTVEVNRYLWQASLDVLNFLPIESVDPFTGVIVTGYGTPPGGGRAYRATIYISDPALDARSLRVSLQGRGGAAVSPQTQRAIEDAILTRAREIRVRDSRL
ncbi:DUF3576 domain-containing protein [Gemmobacter lutimaris]|uniref:DUF3576 domain-containing protein n=1 Tax=Gemmobacter lutimaris TaxID=2306023 RepID=A0A398BV56_9RHOB|nr:DUF3576 domain-containing protein [Gemmobacter lutimaris]RID92358.1 DUF3576 domain-containing protein [Gemmobacter lutimaris]